MKCPCCGGAGGFTDYFGEYDECDVCSETGEVTQARADEYYEGLRKLDADIDRQMASERKT